MTLKFIIFIGVIKQLSINQTRNPSVVELVAHRICIQKDRSLNPIIGNSPRTIPEFLNLRLEWEQQSFPLHHRIGYVGLFWRFYIALTIFQSYCELGSRRYPISEIQDSKSRPLALLSKSLTTPTPLLPCTILNPLEIPVECITKQIKMKQIKTKWNRSKRSKSKWNGSKLKETRILTKSERAPQGIM